LIEVIVITLLGVIAFTEGWEGIAAYGNPEKHGRKVPRQKSLEDY
jgi:hypothetical protein